MAVQEGPTGIRVSWTPPTPLGDITGYRIYYSGGSSGSVNISGGSTDNYLLNGLENEASYNISIVGISEHLPSNHVHYPSSIQLGEQFKCVIEICISNISICSPTDEITITVNAVDVSSIIFSWTRVDGINPTTYTISYSNTNNTQCFNSSFILLQISGSATGHTIDGLEEATEYIITVTMFYDERSSSDRVAATTLPGI